jgi:hypothetical protein
MWLMVKLFMRDKSLSEVFVVGVEGAEVLIMQKASPKPIIVNSLNKTSASLIFAAGFHYKAHLPAY